MLLRHAAVSSNVNHRPFKFSKDLCSSSVIDAVLIIYANLYWFYASTGAGFRSDFKNLFFQVRSYVYCSSRTFYKPDANIIDALMEF